MTATITPVVRGATDREFNSVRVSPSRVNSFLSCGIAFERKYIKKEKPQAFGTAALFGNVMHKANEWWAVDRTQDMVALTGKAWIDQTEESPVVMDFLREYQSISVEVMRAEAEARASFEKRNPGKESKAPRMTREFKESAAAKKLNRLLAQWIPKLDAKSKWKFTERDPLPQLYDESLRLAKKYSHHWRDKLPNSLHAEFGFTVEWEGFQLIGFIDTIEPVLREGELIGYVVGDYKTYKNEAPEAKDHRQGVFYDVAFELLCRNGALPYDPELPRWIVFDYMRLLNRKDYRLNERDRAVLLDDLQKYQRGVDNKVFLPAQKNYNPDFCDFPESCCLRTRGEGTGCRGGLYPEATDGEET